MVAFRNSVAPTAWILLLLALVAPLRLPGVVAPAALLAEFWLTMGALIWTKFEPFSRIDLPLRHLTVCTF